MSVCNKGCDNKGIGIDDDSISLISNQSYTSLNSLDTSSKSYHDNFNEIRKDSIDSIGNELFIVNQLKNEINEIRIEPKQTIRRREREPQIYLSSSPKINDVIDIIRNTNITPTFKNILDINNDYIIKTKELDNKKN